MIADYQTYARMAAKRQAVPLPDVEGKRVLDVGTDFGWWAFNADDLGASEVLGLDRNRLVRGEHVDLIAMNNARAVSEGRDGVRFEHINLGKQWRSFGRFDVVLLLSLYHHVYEAAGGDHEPIWFWLSQHVAAGGELLWEGPVDDSDPVVRANVSDAYRGGYTREAILAAAARYFGDAEFIGPALHEPTREVWRFTYPRHPARIEMGATLRSGAGGATPAFEYADGRRINEIETALGFRPFPGSLNLELGGLWFNWRHGYYRAEVLDVVERGHGLDVQWAPRWARFYPLTIEGLDACAFRFEGERYRLNFLELIAPLRLRDRIAGPSVTLTR